MSERSRKHAAVTLLVAALFASGAWLALRMTHSLERHASWGSGKLLQENTGLLGAEDFTTSRNSLAGDRLNLERWYGHQEVYRKDPARVGELLVRFRLEANAYLLVLFRDAAGSAVGVRVSRNPLFPSALVAVDPVGKFTRKQPLSLPEPGDAWNELELKPLDGALGLRWNGTAMPALDATVAGPATIVVRGGRHPAAVARIRALNREGHELFDERFANAPVAPLALFSAAIALVALLVSPGGERKRTLVVHATTFLSTVLLAGLDARYVAHEHFSGAWPSRKVVSEAIDRGNGEVARLLEPLLAHPAKLRVLLLGTSQTWGTGARVEGERWSNLLEKKLAARTGVAGALLNTGVRASNLERLVDEHRARWARWKPQLVIAVLGSSDRGRADFAANLEKLVALDAAIGAKTVFVLEATDPETSQDMEGEETDGMSESSLLARHRDLLDVAARHGIPVLDAHRYYSSPQVADSGLLWWDFAHLTSYGQALMADQVYAQILKILGDTSVEM
ncbi:MAG: SGNH/GDSL hydrolase family protein [Deltaproteobacteria bacterium]|nr:SGNH/GDSL hydrolase family protein [Deltaproteobacteria bacterium]